MGRCCFGRRFHQRQHTRLSILFQHHTQCPTCPPFHVNQPCRHTYRHTSILTQPFQQRIRERLETVLECIIGRVGVLRHCVGPEIVRIHFLQHRQKPPPVHQGIPFLACWTDHCQQVFPRDGLKGPCLVCVCRIRSQKRLTRLVEPLMKGFQCTVMVIGVRQRDFRTTELVGEMANPVVAMGDA